MFFRFISYWMVSVFVNFKQVVQPTMKNFLMISWGGLKGESGLILALYLNQLSRYLN